MAQAELFDIESPCISVCEMDDKGYCKGCLRNRTERQLWHAMNDEQKRQVLHLLWLRRKKRLRTASGSKLLANDNPVYNNAEMTAPQPTLFTNLSESTEIYCKSFGNGLL